MGTVIVMKIYMPINKRTFYVGCIDYKVLLLSTVISLFQFGRFSVYYEI